MREPEDLLRSLPAESPPPEVVMAALRVFRYRALAVIALACAIVVSAFILKAKFDEDVRLLERIGRIQYTTGSSVTVADLREVDGLQLMLWEVVLDGTKSSYVHVIARDEGGRAFSLDIVDPEVDGRPTSLAAVEGSGGGQIAGLTHMDLWQEIRLGGSSDPELLSFDVRVEGAGVARSIPFEVEI